MLPAWAMFAAQVLRYVYGVAVLPLGQRGTKFRHRDGGNDVHHTYDASEAPRVRRRSAGESFP